MTLLNPFFGEFGGMYVPQILIPALLQLEKAGEVRTMENQANRTTATAEFYVARQENAFRGYLLSQDPYYIERVDAHRAKFLAAYQSFGVAGKVKRAIPAGTHLRIVEIDSAGRDLKSQSKFPVIWARVVVLDD